MHQLPINLKVEFAGQSTLDSSWGQERYRNPYTRIYHVTSGRDWIRSPCFSGKLRPGYLYLLPSYTECIFGTNKLIKIQWLHLTAVHAETMDLVRYLGCKHESRIDSQRVRPIMARILTLFNKTSCDASRLETTGLVLQLLSMLLSGTNTETPSRQQAIARFLPVISFIDTNLAQECTVSELACLVHLNRSSFSTQFSELFGISPSQYIQRKRIEVVRNQLETTNDTLETIATVSGFCDAFHLSRTFKKITGISPYTFRHQPPERIP